MNKVVIVGGARTAVGAFGGSLKDISAIDLGALAIRGALQKSGLKPVAGPVAQAAAPDRVAAALTPAPVGG